MAGTKYFQLRGFVEWAQLFEDNRDKESTDPQVNKMLKKVEGLYKVRFYPADQSQLALAKDNLCEDLYGGGKRFKDGTPELGTGVYFYLKRKHKDPSGIEKFGGPPKIVHWSGDRKGELWDREVDGNIGNGSEVVLNISRYGEGTGQTVRLESVGVVANIEYVPEERL